jgi:hypothetical protein
MPVTILTRRERQADSATLGMTGRPNFAERPVQIIHLETELPTSADKVWQAMCHPASFTYVLRGLIGVPALAGRTEPFREGESGTGWLLLFHLIPLSRHTICLASLDQASKTLRSREHGGILRTWNHQLHVESVSDRRCCYSDTIEIDAGALTGIVAAMAKLIFRDRQRRWHKLVRNHLMPSGPRYASKAA